MILSAYAPPYESLAEGSVRLEPDASSRLLYLLQIMQPDDPEGFRTEASVDPAGHITLGWTHWADLNSVLLTLEGLHADYPAATPLHNACRALGGLPPLSPD